MKKNIKFIEPEPEDRYCPICDAEIKEGSPLHKCSKKKLKEIESMNIDEEYLEEDRTYDDKLREYEEYFNYNNCN